VDPLTIALPTGRLWSDAAETLRRAGIPLERSPAGRQLLIDLPTGVRVLATKPADLLAYVEQGAADAGIAGRDMILEQSRDVYELLDLRFGACRAVVAFPEDRAAALWQPGRLLRIATKYPRLTARYFDEQERAVEIVVLYGSVELAPLVGLSDGIVDLVMSGRTLRANRLREVAEIATSTARLVVNRGSLSRSPRVMELVDNLRGVVAPRESEIRV
jgi:ATP phosphoribosyltransferase